MECLRDTYGGGERGGRREKKEIRSRGSERGEGGERGKGGREREKGGGGVEGEKEGGRGRRELTICLAWYSLYNSEVHVHVGTHCIHVHVPESVNSRTYSYMYM